MDTTTFVPDRKFVDKLLYLLSQLSVENTDLDGVVNDMILLFKEMAIKYKLSPHQVYLMGEIMTVHTLGDIAYGKNEKLRLIACDSNSGILENESKVDPSRLAAGLFLFTARYEVASVNELVSIGRLEFINEADHVKNVALELGIKAALAKHFPGFEGVVYM